MARAPLKQSVRFLLVGKTGCGKSSTGNTILGLDVFDSKASFHSVTSSCTLRRGMHNDTAIEVMDCPGLFDTGKMHEDVATEVIQAVACMHPGFTAILYVIMIGSRYTEEEAGVYYRLKALFDHHVTQYIIIIFSRGDELKRREEKIDDFLMKAPVLLHKVLDECGHRYLVFDNMTDDKQPQVDRLLQEVLKLSEAHGGKPYTCPKYGEVGEKMEKEIERRMQKVEEEEVRTKEYVEKLNQTMKQIKEQAVVDKLLFKNKEKERDEQEKKKREEMDQHLEAFVKAFDQQRYCAEQRHQEELRLSQIREEELMQQITELERQREVHIAFMGLELSVIFWLLAALLAVEHALCRQINARIQRSRKSCLIM